MKTKIKKGMTGLLLMFCFSILCMVTIAAARPARKNTQAVNPPSSLLIAMAFDLSPSFAGYRRADTAFVGRICRNVARSGGSVVVYGIGNISDKSGLRCTLKPLPAMDPSLVLSQQLALKKRIDLLKAYNEQIIREFLKVVQEQILGPPAVKIRETDIAGCLRKLDVLMSEPEFARYKRMAFVYSDGLQCTGGRTTNARYDFTGNKNFSLYLCGWKTPHPTHSVAIQQFEDCQGFADFLENSYTLKI